MKIEIRQSNGRDGWTAGTWAYSVLAHNADGSTGETRDGGYPSRTCAEEAAQRSAAILTKHGMS